MTTNLKFQYPEIPYQAQSFTHNLYSYVGSATQELVSGPRYKCFSLTQSTYSDLWLNMDMGSGNTATASILSVLRAKLLKESGVNVLQLIPSAQSPFTPSTISGLQFWFDASREVTTDSSGLISQWNDLSGNGKHLTQSTSANRPLLTRADNLENWLKYSVDWTNSVHQKESTTVTTSTTVYDSNGRLIVDKVTASAASSRHSVYQAGPATNGSGVSYTYSVEVKKSNYRYLWIGDRAFSSWHGVCFDFDTASLGTQASLTAASLETLTGGWYKITISYTSSSAGNPTPAVYFNTSNATSSPQSFLAAGTEVFYACHCSLRSSTASSTYIQTDAIIQRKGINGVRAAYFDGSNDYLSVTDTNHTEFTSSGTMFFVFSIPTEVTGTNYQLIYCENFTVSGYLVRLQPQVSGGHKPLIRTNQAGASTEILATSTPVVRDSVHILTAHKSGTTGTIYIDGVSAVSGTLNNAVTTTQTLKVGGDAQPFQGRICEIIHFNSALNSTDRQAVEAYLTSKYKTTPTVDEKTFDTIALRGPKDEDYVSSFTTTSAVRYFWLHLSSTKINSYDFSKVYLGNGFDFGRDPVWGRRSELEPDERGSRAPRYKYSFEYEDITDAVVQDFITKIASKADVNPVVMVTGSYHDVLNDDRLVHCKIKEFSYEPISYNQNNVSLVLEELI